MTGRGVVQVLPSPHRLGTALRLEVRLLRRYGILAATAATTAGWAVLLRLLPEGARPLALELLAYTQLALVGYTFAAALVLLEKGERCSLALAVTPLQLREQLLARVLALTALAGVATAAVVVAAGVAPTSGWFPVGVVATSVLALLASLAGVAPHDSMTRWVLPSVPPLVLIAVPLIAYLGVRSPLLWLLPTNGALVLLRGPDDALTAAGALAVTAAWAALLAKVAADRFRRWVATADA